MPNPFISIVATGFEEAGRKLKSVDIPKASQEGLEAYAFAIERGAKIASPVDTGRLRASIATDIGNLRAIVAPHVDYAIFVHEGTRFMKGVPFMSIGLSQADSRGGSGFTAALERELNNKLR